MARFVLTTRLLAAVSGALMLALVAPGASAADAMPGMAKATRQELGASALFVPAGSLLVVA